MVQDLSNTNSSQLASIDTPTNSRDRASNSAIPNSPASELILEAQGWIKDANGKTVLVAHTPISSLPTQTIPCR
ncbi:hypothetical protein [Leptolyngbya sp. GGD]|uniref:hypothetical protein n=1 Tax=Leptolyngbya sp. GGD TaxID=2997907 RepID=UPI00227BD858|nr:hypothetical protein [Leptolyngbya sp. GGD]MCY6493873.1 hypothetical protein [Leptolyngbya sp. GGD]